MTLPWGRAVRHRPLWLCTSALCMACTVASGTHCADHVHTRPACLQACCWCTPMWISRCTSSTSTAATWPPRVRRKQMLLWKAGLQCHVQARGSCLLSTRMQAAVFLQAARRFASSPTLPPRLDSLLQTHMSAWPPCAPPPMAACCWPPAPAAWSRCVGCTPSRLVVGCFRLFGHDTAAKHQQFKWVPEF